MRWPVEYRQIFSSSWSSCLELGTHAMYKIEGKKSDVHCFTSSYLVHLLQRIRLVFLFPRWMVNVTSTEVRSDRR